MAIKVIVELQGQPGRRDELVCLLESWSQPKDRASMVSWAAPGMPCSGTLTRSYEIADWESAEARQAHLQEAAATGAYAPLLDLPAAPLRPMVIRKLT